MKRRSVIILSITSAIVAVCFLFPYAVSWLLRPSVPKPHSDLPITADLGWWPYQDGLKVTRFVVEADHPHLNLFNNRFLLRYQLVGTITYRKGWRPRLVNAQITGRLVSRPSDQRPSEVNDSSQQQPSVADILLVPVVEVSEDATYSEEKIPFSVKLEQIVQTMNWGPNRYEIRCLDQNATVSVEQSK